MVAQMSKKSKIYHRPGCRFINRIEVDSLVTFDFEDGRIEDLQPCKCCCTLKSLYMNYKENLRTVFEDLPISTEFDGEYVRVHTDWYDWRIGLKSSSQNIKLFREEWNEEYQNISLIKCTDMEKSKSIGTAMRYIANEERVAAYPVMFRKQAIVNTANDHPTVGTGCDSAVYKAAGYDKLLKYREEKIGFVPEGDAFITPGFKLKAKYIIHAVRIMMPSTKCLVQRRFMI